MNKNRDSRKIVDTFITLYNDDEYDKALRRILQAIRINPDNGHYYKDWGDTLWGLKRYKEAELRFARAGRMVTTDYEIYLNCGIMLYYQGKWDQAILRYVQAWSIKPNDIEICKHWGRALMKQEKYEEAIAKHQIALEQDPGNSDLHFEWGRVLYEQGKYREAICQYDKTLQLDEKDTYTYFNKEMALRHLDCQEEAEEVHCQGKRLLKKDSACKDMIIESIKISINVSGVDTSSENLLALSNHVKTKLELLQQLLDKLKNISEEDEDSDEKVYKAV